MTNGHVISLSLGRLSQSGRAILYYEAKRLESIVDAARAKRLLKGSRG